MPPPPSTAFLSIKPLEPVLVFRTPEDAARFQTELCREARIYKHTSQKWVYLPMPEGLVRVRTTRNGDIAFDFETESQSKRFSDQIRYGRVYENSKKTIKPLVTLVPVLPETGYKDEDNSDRKPLAFIKAQYNLLKSLNNIAAEFLSPVQAATFTASIDPKNRRPSAKDALRFCYYMRSQDFGTYARIDAQEGIMRLYVANKIKLNRTVADDTLYWKQDLQTDHVLDWAQPSVYDIGPYDVDTYERVLGTLPSRFAGVREVDPVVIAPLSRTEVERVRDRLNGARNRLNELIDDPTARPLDLDRAQSTVRDLMTQLAEM